jgi:hypothetical protein
MLTVGALALGRSGRWTWAALAAALATVTRSGGLLVCLPLGMMLIQQRGWNPRRWWIQGVQLLSAALMPFAFAWHVDRLWGDPLKMVHVQERWGRSPSTPWDTLQRSWRVTSERYGLAGESCALEFNINAINRCRAGLQVTTNAISDDLSIVAMATGLLLLPYAIWRLLPRDSVYLAAGLTVPLLIPATEDPLQSMARYLIVLFPLYIALAVLLRSRPLFALGIALSTVALSGCLSLFAQRYFVA